MRKKEVKLDFKRFCKEGDYVRKHENDVIKVITVATGSYLIIGTPKLAFASAKTGAGISDFHSLYVKVMAIFDGLVVIALIISAGAWMFGTERSKVIERIIYACSGYILARHAEDIRDWLKLI